MVGLKMLKEMMMSSSADKSIVITPIDVDTEMQTMTGHDSPVWDVKFNSNGSRVVSVADNGSIQTYIRQEMFYTCLLVLKNTFFFLPSCIIRMGNICCPLSRCENVSGAIVSMYCGCNCKRCGTRIRRHIYEEITDQNRIL